MKKLTILLMIIIFMLPGFAIALIDTEPVLGDYQTLAPQYDLTKTTIATLDSGGDSDPFWITADTPMGLPVLVSRGNDQRTVSLSHGLMRLGEAAAGVSRRHWLIDH